MKARARLAAFACAFALATTTEARRASGDDERPRLVVLVVVDQMIPEQLERLRPLLRGGLRRFAEGRRYTSCAFPYAATETCPGHTTIGTGALPRRHGIVGNDWLARESDQSIYCVRDENARRVDGDGPTERASYSPRHVRVPGLSDRLERVDPRSRTIALSTKDRAAIGLGGRKPDLCAWWDRSDARGFVSSTWYVERLPSWLVEWNARWVERARKSELASIWRSSLPDSLEGTETAADARDGEARFLDRRNTFPYDAPELSDPPTAKELRAYASTWCYATPLADELVLDAARAAVVHEDLGLDEHVDLLAISLSACDVVGHACGPLSREVTDLLLRADRELEGLFALLDRRVGAGRWLAALSADHGALELPESLRAQGLDAGRVEADAFGEAVDAAREELDRRFGDDFFVAADAFGLRLSAERMRAAGVDAREARGHAARAFAAAAPWCARVYTADELAEPRSDAPADDAIELQRNSFDPERSSDLIVQPKERWLIAVDAGTSHCTPYAYDRRVPLAFIGAGISAARVNESVTPLDIVPTVLARIGLPSDGDIDGRVLSLR